MGTRMYSKSELILFRPLFLSHTQTKLEICTNVSKKVLRMKPFQFEEFTRMEEKLLL